MKKLIFILLTALSISAQSQTIMHTRGLSKMDKGKDAMLDGNYQQADKLLKEALATIEKIPSELTYYFGRNSYHLKKHKQAIKWLNKYIELKGTTGQYSKDAIKYLELSNVSYLAVRKQQIDDTGSQLNDDGKFDCPGDNVFCPPCNGTGVIISTGTFDIKYKTCPYSGIEGILTCDEYNLFLRGQLKPRVEADK